MPKVVNSAGKVVAEVDDDLLRDFFDEIFIEEKDFIETLTDYKLGPRSKLVQYIIYRLAEVDPGYLPTVDYE